jgi:hypothetical protein
MMNYVYYNTIPNVFIFLEELKKTLKINYGLRSVVFLSDALISKLMTIYELTNQPTHQPNNYLRVRQALLENIIFPQPIKKSSHCRQPVCISPYSQKPRVAPVVNKTNPVQDFSLLFNIILLPTPRFAK